MDLAGRHAQHGRCFVVAMGGRQLPMPTTITYYGISEGLWGASIGKVLPGCGIRQPTVSRRGWRGRCGVLWSSKHRAWLLCWRRWPSVRSGHHCGLASLRCCLASRSRRRGDAMDSPLCTNSPAGREPSGVPSAAFDPLWMRPSFPPMRPPGRVRRENGPYEVVRTLGSTDVGELLVGFDPSLRRQVWIHTLPSGAAAVAPLIRDLGRSGRLRWLNGRRSTSEAWDAYEALDGVPLVNVLDTPKPWRAVRLWLLDLAREIDAGLQDGSITALTIGHVWITRDGYAKLLDFRAPGVPTANQREAVTLESAQSFLESVGRCALDGSADDQAGTTARARDPLPLSATATLETLARRGFSTSAEMVTRMAALLQGPDRVTRGRRAAHFCALVPAIFLLMDSVLLPPNLELLMTPNERALNNALTRLSSLTQEAREERAEERAALEVYIAGRFRSMMVTDPYMFTSPATGRVLEARRPLIERVVADQPTVSADDLTTATATLGPFLRAQERRHKLKLALFGGPTGVVRAAWSLGVSRWLDPPRLWHRHRHGRREASFEIARALARAGRMGPGRRGDLALGCVWRRRRGLCGRPGPGGRSMGHRASDARIGGSDRRHMARAAMTPRIIWREPIHARAQSRYRKAKMPR